MSLDVNKMSTWFTIENLNETIWKTNSIEVSFLGFEAADCVDNIFVIILVGF